jgi:hypothetical protein
MSNKKDHDSKKRIHIDFGVDDSIMEILERLALDREGFSRILTAHKAAVPVLVAMPRSRPDTVSDAR